MSGVEVVAQVAAPAALVLGGGLGLGAYQLGAFAVLAQSGRISVQAIAGASMGAINGAIIAGAPPDQQVERLEGFWRSVETDATAVVWPDPFGLARAGPARQARNWLNVLAAHTLGVRGVFEPRLRPGVDDPPSLYDTRPLLQRFERYVDFDRLNRGAIRYVAAATDVETGELVVFDTAAGDRIGPHHLLASGGLLPAFPGVEIDGRLLADGGLSANAPFEPLLASSSPQPRPPLCVLLDLFAPDGERPRTLQAAAHRANDLKFATQTRQRLEGLGRELGLEAELAPARPGVDLLYLSYRPGPDEAGQEKTYDFAPATLRERRAAGAADARAALVRLDGLGPLGAPGLRVHAVRRA